MRLRGAVGKAAKRLQGLRHGARAHMLHGIAHVQLMACRSLGAPRRAGTNHGLVGERARDVCVRAEAGSVRCTRVGRQACTHIELASLPCIAFSHKKEAWQGGKLGLQKKSRCIRRRTAHARDSVLFLIP